MEFPGDGNGLYALQKLERARESDGLDREAIENHVCTQAQVCSWWLMRVRRLSQ
jgi:hypothetical protein